MKVLWLDIWEDISSPGAANFIFQTEMYSSHILELPIGDNPFFFTERMCVKIGPQLVLFIQILVFFFLMIFIKNITPLSSFFKMCKRPFPIRVLPEEQCTPLSYLYFHF